MHTAESDRFTPQLVFYLSAVIPLKSGPDLVINLAVHLQIVIRKQIFQESVERLLGDVGVKRSPGLSKTAERDTSCGAFVSSWA